MTLHRGSLNGGALRQRRANSSLHEQEFFSYIRSLGVINSEGGSMEMSTVLVSMSALVAQTPVRALRETGSSRTQLVSSSQQIFE